MKNKMASGSIQLFSIRPLFWFKCLFTPALLWECTIQARGTIYCVWPSSLISLTSGNSCSLAVLEVALGAKNHQSATLTPFSLSLSLSISTVWPTGPTPQPFHILLLFLLLPSKCPHEAIYKRTSTATLQQPWPLPPYRFYFCPMLSSCHLLHNFKMAFFDPYFLPADKVFSLKC